MSAIDISRYQGVVDFNAVRSAGVGVVIAKVGGGDAGEYVDANWTRNRDGIRGAGLKLGSYFFNGPGSSPTQAADFHFANADWHPGDLLIIDVEGGTIAWSVSEVIEWVNQMLTHGVPASSIGVYMSASVVRNYNWGPVAALGTFLWVASYGANTGQPETPPTVIHWAGWTLWQYTSNGSVPGVPGRVDVSQVAPNWAGSGSTPLINLNLQGDDMYSIRNWETKELSLLIGTQRLVLPGTLDVAGIVAVSVAISGQAPDTTTTAQGPWINLSTAQITLLDSALALYPKPATNTTSAPVDLSPVLTQLAALEATLTKGYTFNVKPAA